MTAHVQKDDLRAALQSAISKMLFHIPITFHFKCL